MFDVENKKILAFFKTKFAKELRLRHKGASECLLLLSLGLFGHLNTVAQVSTHLGIPKDQFYRRLGELSLKDWKNLFDACYADVALSALQKLQAQSPASWSRAKVQLSVDDSVLRKYGRKNLAFLGNWFSGLWKQVVNGYDVLLVVLQIKDQVIPVCFHLQSQKDQTTNRIERMAKLVESVGQRWLQAGIDLKRIAVTADNGYCEPGLIDKVEEVGFKKIVLGASKGWNVYNRADEDFELPIKLGQLMTKQNIAKVESKAWAIDRKVLADKFLHESLGEILVMGRIAVGEMRVAMAKGIDRSAEMYRIWKAHFQIEQLFRLLKSRLAWGKYQLQGKKGAMATVVITFLAHAMLLTLKKRLKQKQYTLYKLAQVMFNRWLTDFYGLLEDCQLEHFHPKPLTSDCLLKL